MFCNDLKSVIIFCSSDVEPENAKMCPSGGQSAPDVVGPRPYR